MRRARHFGVRMVTYDSTGLEGRVRGASRILPPPNRHRARRHSSQRFNHPARLREAMQYSVLGTGKRVRPLLAYASGELCGVSRTGDRLHRRFGGARPCLFAGPRRPARDGRRRSAARPPHDAPRIRRSHRDPRRRRVAGSGVRDPVHRRAAGRAAGAPNQNHLLARASRRAAGMVGGQALDLAAEGQKLSEEVGWRKSTGARPGQLIRAAIMMPSELADLSPAARQNLDTFARDIGLVFQICDDLLEVEQDTATLGKSAGSDARNDKSTYPSTLGPRRRPRSRGKHSVERDRRAAVARHRRRWAVVAVALHFEPIVLKRAARAPFRTGSG